MKIEKVTDLLDEVGATHRWYDGVDYRIGSSQRGGGDTLSSDYLSCKHRGEYKNHIHFCLHSTNKYYNICTDCLEDMSRADLKECIVLLYMQS